MEEELGEPASDLQHRRRQPIPGQKECDLSQHAASSQAWEKRVCSGQEGSPRASKKGRHGKETSKSHKSLSFPLEGGFLKKSYEEYRADPVGAFVNVFKHVADITKRQIEDAERQTREARWEREEEKTRTEEARKKLESVQTDLAKSQKSLSNLQKQKEKAELEKNSSVSKVKDLELWLAASEAKAKKLAKTNSTLQKQNSNFQTRVIELEVNLKTAKEEKEGSELEVAETVEQALEMGTIAFSNALEHIAMILPSFIPDQEVLKPDHGVVNGRIVKVDAATKEQIVIYSPPFGA